MCCRNMQSPLHINSGDFEKVIFEKHNVVLVVQVERENRHTSVEDGLGLDLPQFGGLDGEGFRGGVLMLHQKVVCADVALATPESARGSGSLAAESLL